jgi:hypothetical protein
LVSYRTVMVSYRMVLGLKGEKIVCVKRRLASFKSMLYSQINYLGCFLPMPDNITEMISNLIVNFVKGNLNIAKKRLFLSVEDGGLGLFPIRDFLDTQKCAWIKRCNDFSEPWTLIIYISNFGCLFNSKSKNINKTEFPICYSICSSFERVTNAFTVSMENYNKSYIFECAKFTMDLESKETFNRGYFSEDQLMQCMSKLYSLRYCDLFDGDGNFLTIAQIELLLGTEITPLQVFQLRNVCSVTKLRYSKKTTCLQK